MKHLYKFLLFLTVLGLSACSETSPGENMCETMDRCIQASIDMTTFGVTTSFDTFDGCMQYIDDTYYSTSPNGSFFKYEICMPSIENWWDCLGNASCSDLDYILKNEDNRCSLALNNVKACIDRRDDNW